MLFTDITDCEMIVLKCIMDAEEPQSLVQLQEVLQEEYGKLWKRSTICTFILHLTEKGYVDSYRKGRTFYYSATTKREEFSREQAQVCVDFWYDGSLPKMVASLGSSGLSDADREELRDIISKL